MTLAHTYPAFARTEDHFQFGWEMGRVGRALATGYGFSDPFDGHTGPTAWNPPLYPLLIGAVFRIFGVYTQLSAWVILAINLNSVFSAATAPAIVFEIAHRCFAQLPKHLNSDSSYRPTLCRQHRVVVRDGCGRSIRRPCSMPSAGSGTCA